MPRRISALALSASAIAAALSLSCAAPRSEPPPADVLVTLDVAALGPDAAALGERLFFDPRLSGDNTVSCASCHDPARAFTDGRRVPVGISKRPLARNAPPLFNLEARAPYFWDGRAVTLEEQALGPIANPDEMGQDLELLSAELSADPELRDGFARTFPGEGVTPLGVARALAAYERTLISRGSPYDRHLAGDAAALSDEERFGLDLFSGKAECTTCHNGPDLTDNQFHRVGVPGDDPGRAAVDPVSGPRGGMKTPSLREVARTAPYFHDGSVASLDDVIEHYARGGDPAAGDRRDIHPLALSAEEKRALAAFLRALSSPL